MGNFSERLRGSDFWRKREKKKGGEILIEKVKKKKKKKSGRKAKREIEREHRKEKRTGMGTRFSNFLGRKRGFGKMGFEK